MNTSLDSYLARSHMARNGVWGTDIENLSTASLLTTDVFVYTKFGETYKWQKFSRTMLDGKKPENDCSIYLKHSNGIHYDVVLDVNVDNSTESISQTSLSDDIHNFEAKKKSQLNDELTNVEFQRKRKVNTTIPVLHTSKDKNKRSRTKNHFTKKTKKQKQTTQTSLSDDIGNVEAEKKNTTQWEISKCPVSKKEKSKSYVTRKVYKKKTILPENKAKKKGGPQKKNGFTKAENRKPTPQNDLHKLAVKNMMKFHKSQDYTIYRCKICCEAWPQKTKKGNGKKVLSNYVCANCVSSSLRNFLKKIL